MTVSIHTPTQGVTKMKVRAQQMAKFQSTHPRRVWRRHIRRYSLWRCFNPHTHAGCDYEKLCLYQSWFCFNPHTHAGCDFNRIHNNDKAQSFNPHTHAGCDIYFDFFSNSQWEFQSTHPRRVWLASSPVIVRLCLFQSTHPRRVWQCPICWAYICCTGFNPHTHAGCDRHQVIDKRN